MDEKVFDAQSLSLPEGFSLDVEQAHCVELVKQGENVFITGNAGTGKSTLLTFLRKEVLVNRNVAYLAPTGVAAININGFTIHKFFGFFTKETFEYMNGSDYRPKNRDLMKCLDTLVIDEISMVRADLMDYVDIALRRYGPDKDKPFGGVQLILIGDPYQLAPIVKGEERAFIESRYRSEFFFDCMAMQKVQCKLVKLVKIYRQKDPDFLDVLNHIRIGNTTIADFEYLNSHIQSEYSPPVGEFCVTLATTNATVDGINSRSLDALGNQIFKKRARLKGDFPKTAYPNMEYLEFAVGAQIMMVANDAIGKSWEDGKLVNREEMRWANGTLGIVESIHLDESTRPYVMVKLSGSGATHKVKMHEWEMLTPGFSDGKLTYEVAGTFTQFPFKLAWAITIHKSQGKTYDNVILDLTRKVFSPGQLYVTLSRCTSVEGIVLIEPVTPDQVMVHERVVEYFLGRSA